MRLTVGFELKHSKATGFAFVDGTGEINVSTYATSEAQAAKKLKPRLEQAITGLLSAQGRTRALVFFAQGRVALVEWQADGSRYWYTWHGAQGEPNGGGGSLEVGLDESIAYLVKHFSDVYGAVRVERFL
mgnify:CR=1 FL=1